MGLGDAPRIRRVYDHALLLKDAGLVAADAAWQVGGADKIYDLGSDTALIRAVCIVDVSAIEVDTTDESYQIVIQGSTKDDFSSEFDDLAQLTLGHASAVAMRGDRTSPVGRYEIPFTNVKGGNVFRYLRGYTDVTGTIATGINFIAWLARLGSRDL